MGWPSLGAGDRLAGLLQREQELQEELERELLGVQLVELLPLGVPVVPVLLAAVSGPEAFCLWGAPRSLRTRCPTSSRTRFHRD